MREIKNINNYHHHKKCNIIYIRYRARVFNRLKLKCTIVEKIPRNHTSYNSNSDMRFWHTWPKSLSYAVVACNPLIQLLDGWEKHHRQLLLDCKKDFHLLLLKPCCWITIKMNNVFFVKDKEMLLLAHTHKEILRYNSSMIFESKMDGLKCEKFSL